MSERFHDGYALLIGITENEIEKYALPVVGQDVSAMLRVLVHPLRCAYPEDQVRVITGKAATRQGILDGLDWLRSQAVPGATAIVYYSGHGWRSVQGQSEDFFLIPYDLDPDDYRGSALPAGEFGRAIDLLRPHRLLVVLDCCHAGGMDVKDVAAPQEVAAPGMAAPGMAAPEAGVEEAAFDPNWLVGGPAVEPARPTGPAKGLEALAHGAGRAVISSSKGAQKSYFRRDQSMSIFTYHLIEALSGYASAQGGASEILVSDVMSHVWREVPRSALREAGAAQEPDYRVQGNFPVALLLGGKGLPAGQAPPDPFSILEQRPGREPAVAIQAGDHAGVEVNFGTKISGTISNIGPGAQAAIGTGITQQNIHIEPGQQAARDRRQALFAGLESSLATLPLSERERRAAAYNLAQMKEQLVEMQPPQDPMRLQTAVDWLMQNVGGLRESLARFFQDADVRRDVAASSWGEQWLQEEFARRSE